MKTETPAYAAERVKYATRPVYIAQPYHVVRSGLPAEWPFSRGFASGPIDAATRDYLDILVRPSGNTQTVVPEEGQSSLGTFTLPLQDQGGEVLRYLSNPRVELAHEVPGAIADRPVFLEGRTSIGGYPAVGTLQLGAERVRYRRRDDATNRFLDLEWAVDGTGPTGHLVGAVMQNGEQLRAGQRVQLLAGYRDLDERAFLRFAKMEITNVALANDGLTYVIAAADIQRFLRQLVFPATQAAVIDIEGHPITIALRMLISTGTAAVALGTVQMRTPNIVQGTGTDFLTFIRAGETLLVDPFAAGERVLTVTSVESAERLYVVEPIDEDSAVGLEYRRAGRAGPYDVFNGSWSVAMPRGFVDVAGLEALRERFPTTRMRFRINTPEEGKEFLEREIWKPLNCLRGGTLIETDRGRVRINHIVAHRLPVRVKTMNTETGLLEWGRVVNWIARPGVQDWVRLSYPGPHHCRELVATPDHELWTGTEMRAAEKFQAGDEVFVLSPTLSPDQEQVILGGLLGDASLCRRSRHGTTDRTPWLTESHSASQLAYLQWKQRALTNLGAVIGHPISVAKEKGGEKKYRVVQMRTSPSPCLVPFADLCRPYGYKRVTWEWLSRLTVMGLSVWFMDDGNFNIRPHRRPRLAWTVSPATDEELGLYQRYFVERWGCRPPHMQSSPGNGHRRNRAWTLTFGSEDSARLLEVMRPYIALGPEYPWKRWVADNISAGRAGAVPVRLRAVKRVTLPRPRTAYDITVEPTHTFIASGVVSSNCYPFVTQDGAYSARVYEGRAGTPAATLDEDQIIGWTWQGGEERIINQVEVQYDWNDTDTPNSFGLRQRYTANGSVEKYGRRPPFKMAAKGLRSTHGVQDELDRWAFELFQRFSDSAPRLQLIVRYGQHVVDIGDTVAVTHGRIPNRATGARGVVAEPFQVRDVRPMFGAEGKVVMTLSQVSVLDTIDQPVGDPAELARTDLVIQRAAYFNAATETLGTPNVEEIVASVTVTLQSIADTLLIEGKHFAATGSTTGTPTYTSRIRVGTVEGTILDATDPEGFMTAFDDKVPQTFRAKRDNIIHLVLHTPSAVGPYTIVMTAVSNLATATSRNRSLVVTVRRP